MLCLRCSSIWKYPSLTLPTCLGDCIESFIIAVCLQNSADLLPSGMGYKRWFLLLFFFLLDTVAAFVLSFQKLLDFFLLREILKKEANSIWHVWILIIFHNFLLESQQLVFIDRLGNVPFHSVLNFYFSRVCLASVSGVSVYTIWVYFYFLYVLSTFSSSLYIFPPFWKSLKACSCTNGLIFLLWPLCVLFLTKILILLWYFSFLTLYF